MRVILTRERNRSHGGLVAVPKRLVFVAVLLAAAVLAVALWSDRTAPRSNSRAAPARPHRDEAPREAEARPGPRLSGGLAGRVLEEGSDQPVAHATVLAYAFETAQTLRATTAADGTFDLPDAPFAIPFHRVTIEQLRKAYDARPFVPFVLHLADGREVPVRSREFMTEPRGRTITVYPVEDRMHVIDILLVTDLEFDSRARTSHGPVEPSPP